MPLIELLPVPSRQDTLKAYLTSNFRRVADGLARAASLVGKDDIEITDSTRGIIFTAPSGARFRYTIDNAGNLVKTAL